MIKPRGWQKEALAKFQLSTEKFFLLDATPGSGKTVFAALATSYHFSRSPNDFALIVVPNTAIKGDKDAGFLGDWNKADIQITKILKDGQDRPKQYRGAVVTYSQLPNLIGTVDTWYRKGQRFISIFDELHHASEDNKWGEATELLGRISQRILGMTGTCFRGDERRISFVKYDDDDKAIPNHLYPYRDAVTDRVCRPVDFVTDDSMTQFMLDDTNHEVKVSEVKTEDQIRGATSTVFRTDHDFLRNVIEKADDQLDTYRTWDRDAGGLIICRSGKDDNDNRHLLYVAELVKKTLGEEPEIISYEDPDANAKIERFRNGDQRWICAVRKISEGVDIKRLRIEVMATRPTTELLFRQMVGRVVRVDDEKKPGNATIFIAKFPQLALWAKKISEEAEAGLRDDPKSRPNKNNGDEETRRPFVSFGATHENAGMTSDFGDQYTCDEVNAAERLRGDDPQLADISISTIAHLQRKLGIAPEPMTTADDPLWIKKLELRRKIIKKQRHLAIKRKPQEPDYRQVWREIGATFGPYNADDMVDNYSIEVMRQIDAWLLAQYAGSTKNAE